MTRTALVFWTVAIVALAFVGVLVASQVSLGTALVGCAAVLAVLVRIWQAHEGGH